jgi:hypothetical protein
MKKKTTRAIALALAALTGVLASGALGAASPNGIGRMSVTPDTATAGSTDNELIFTFLADRSSLRGQTIVDVPRGWTPPQRSNPSGPGYVEVKPGTCDGSTRITSVAGRRVTIATSCRRGRNYQLFYHRATAPTISADGYIFLAQTRSAAAGRKAKYRPLGQPKQPKVKVRGGPPVALFVGATSVATSGTAFGVTVRALDTYGNNAYPYGATVQLSSSDPAATLPGPYAYVQADAGQHVFTGTILRTPGTQSITATDSNGLTGQSAPITVYPF